MHSEYHLIRQPKEDFKGKYFWHNGKGDSQGVPERQTLSLYFLSTGMK
jgi:hypothetical protein